MHESWTDLSHFAALISPIHLNIVVAYTVGKGVKAFGLCQKNQISPPPMSELEAAVGSLGRTLVVQHGFSNPKAGKRQLACLDPSPNGTGYHRVSSLLFLGCNSGFRVWFKKKKKKSEFLEACNVSHIKIPSKSNPVWGIHRKHSK